MDATTIIQWWFIANMVILFLYVITKSISFRGGTIREILINGLFMVVSILLFGALVVWFIEVAKIKEMYES